MGCSQSKAATAATENTLPAAKHSDFETCTTAAYDLSRDNSLNNNGVSDADGERTKPKLHRKRRSSILGLEDMKESDDLNVTVVHIEEFGKPIEHVYDGVHDGPILGEGILGKVRLIKHKSTGVNYAVKCLQVSSVATTEGLRQLREEIYIMCQLDHPNIVRLEEVYESEREIYLVQELCVGGELFDRLEEQSDACYNEAQCARLVKQIISSVRYIHSKGIIHRDLKLENFLFSNTSPDSELKMIDFGLSKHFKLGDIHREAVGTPYTVAPEVIKGSYNEKCDIWAVGVLTFLLLSGDAPFGGCYNDDLMQVRGNILRGEFEFEPAEVWDNVSQQARDFITSLLVMDPNLRPTASETQESVWLREIAARDREKLNASLSPNVIKALVSFKEYSDLQRLLREVLSFTLLPEQIADLRREFEKCDTDGSGEISLSGLKRVLLQNRNNGSLTEHDVEAIFDSMRVRKTEARVHWHEFVAAVLCQCSVDDRNLILAFHRLDSDHKGYITFDDISGLIGSDASANKDDLRQMWLDLMRLYGCNESHIACDDFLLLMKGQTLKQKRRSTELSGRKQHRRSTELSDLDEVSETHSSEDDEDFDAEIYKAAKAFGGPEQGGVITAPPQGSQFSTTTPKAPKRRATEFTSPTPRREVLPPSSPDTDDKSVCIIRRSGSLDNLRSYRRSIGSRSSQESVDEVASLDPANVNPLNPSLLSAQQKLRLSVYEASKDFEEKQVRRASVHQFGAGLTMRHGVAKGMSTEALRKMVRQTQKEQLKLVRKANRRVGRGKREKTTSDMTGMLVTPSTLAPTTTLMNGDVEGESAATETRNSSSVSRPQGTFRPSVDPFASLESVGMTRHVLATKPSSFINPSA